MHPLASRAWYLAGIVATGLCGSSAAASCPNAATPKFPVTTANGYSANLLVNGLSTPRGIAFDSAGHLLVVERGLGVQSYTLGNSGGCVSVASQKRVVSDPNLNHGIAFSIDGKTLFVSSSDNVFSYPYNPSTATVTTPGTIIVNNMSNTDHTTRTLTTSQKLPGTLIVSRGSSANIDPDSSVLASGHGQIKAFSTSTTMAARDYARQGFLLGWGLRNDVGVAEHPTTGGIWAVENSLDNIARDGQDFHQNNPAEELNYLGTLVKNTSPNQGKNFGYPACVAAWNAAQVPDAPGLQAGQQFAVDPAGGPNDTYCRGAVVAPRLVFKAHMAPLDIKFTPDGNTAYVSFHGSFDRTVPAGYMVSAIAFRNGQPVAPSTSHTALGNIVTNANTSACTGSTCFRPVGLALDAAGRIFFSSDATGEIFVVTPPA